MEDLKPLDAQSKFEFDSFQAARIGVLGVGGGGGNAVATMAECATRDITLMICNTDIQALDKPKVPIRLQLGEDIVAGKGAGGKPVAGEAAAEESLQEIEDMIRNLDMLFITAGMGGGTGTGAAPRIAKLARDNGIICVGVVTRPFRIEGKKRARIAEEGIQKLKEEVNTLVVIPNQKLHKLDEGKMTMLNAFKKADEVLVNAVFGISDLITKPGYINLDFADICTIMEHFGLAIMGTGSATGENRAVEAARAAINSPLLDDLKIDGAKGVLVNVTGSENLELEEFEEAINCIQESADEDADFIIGYVIDDSMGDEMKVTVIATGCGESQGAYIPEPIESRKFASPTTKGGLSTVPTYVRKNDRTSARTDSERSDGYTSRPPALPEIETFETPLAAKKDVKVPAEAPVSKRFGTMNAASIEADVTASKSVRWRDGRKMMNKRYSK